jgi:CRISPR/Cas system-associated endonuclease Cas3-HD
MWKGVQVFLTTTHKSICVNTKPEFMKLKLCIWELILETKVNQAINIDYNGFENYTCSAIMFCGVLLC